MLSVRRFPVLQIPVTFNVTDINVTGRSTRANAPVGIHTPIIERLLLLVVFCPENIITLGFSVHAAWVIAHNNAPANWMNGRRAGGLFVFEHVQLNGSCSRINSLWERNDLYSRKMNSAPGSHFGFYCHAQHTTSHHLQCMCNYCIIAHCVKMFAYIRAVHIIAFGGWVSDWVGGYNFCYNV